MTRCSPAAKVGHPQSSPKTCHSRLRGVYSPCASSNIWRWCVPPPSCHHTATVEQLGEEESAGERARRRRNDPAGGKVTPALDKWCNGKPFVTRLAVYVGEIVMVCVRDLGYSSSHVPSRPRQLSCFIYMTTVPSSVMVDPLIDVVRPSVRKPQDFRHTYGPYVDLSTARYRRHCHRLWVSLELLFSRDLQKEFWAAGQPYYFKKSKSTLVGPLWTAVVLKD